MNQNLFYFSTAPHPEPSSKVKLKRSEPVKSQPKRPDKLSFDPKRPERNRTPATQTPDPGGPKDLKNDLKSPKVVLQIVKKSHAPPAPVPENPVIHTSVLPPSLKPKVIEKKLRLTKNINNNDVWTNAYETRSLERKKPVVIIR